MVRKIIGLLLAVLALTACSDDDPDPVQLPTPPGAPVQWGGGELAEPLSFHPVEEELLRACTPDDKPSVEDRSKGVATCLRLQPAAFTVSSIVSARRTLANGQWQVSLTLTRADGARFADLTADAAQRPDPQNRIAVVRAGDQLITAPAVMERIADGKVVITGQFTREEIDALIKRLGGQP